MSEENIALGTGLAEAFNRGDVDWIMDHVAEDVEFVPQRVATEGEGAFRGREGIKRFLKDTEDTFDLFHTNLTETRSVKDRVVGIGTIRIKGKGSGIETDIPLAVVLTVRDGRIVRFKDYADRDKALEAAGLS